MTKTKLKIIWQKFKRWIIVAIFGGTALAAGLSGIPQDLYNNLNVNVYTACDLQEARITSIADNFKTFKARNPDNSLRELNAKERASVKSCEMAKRGTEFAGFYDSPQYGVKNEIIGDVKAIEINGQSGIELFARAWRGTQQLGFGVDGSVEIERFRIYNPPILVDDPNGAIIREYQEEQQDRTILTKQRKLREDPIEAIRQVISHNAKLVGKENNKIVIDKIGNTTSTFYPDYDPESTSVDGTVGRTGVDEPWGTIRAGAGTYANDTLTTTELFNFDSAATTNQWYKIMRGIWLFDTSELDDGDVVDSATLSFYGSSKADQNSYVPDVNVYASTPASNTALVAGDYGNTGSTAFSTAITYANFSTTSYNDFVLNASGLAGISKTGISKFSTRNANYDVANVAPSWAFNAGAQFITISADTAGTTQDPKLVVVHTSPAVQGEEYTIIFE